MLQRKLNHVGSSGLAKCQWVSKSIGGHPEGALEDLCKLTLPASRLKLIGDEQLEKVMNSCHSAASTSTWECTQAMQADIVGNGRYSQTSFSLQLFLSVGAR